MNMATPAEVFPPGEFLKDELDARQWSQTEFAEIIGRPVRVVNEIIAGKKSITPETAREIAAALGTSAQFWLNLESSYKLSKTDEAPNRIARSAKLRGRFPVREIVKRGWIEHSDNFDTLETRVLDFFGIQSVDDEPQLAHAAKRNYSERPSQLQLAWLFRVKQLAEALQVNKYTERKLRESLPKLRAMLVEPEEVRHVPRFLAELGVRFVIVEPMPGTKIDGVCFWLNGEAPVIGLSLYRDRIDNFWFVLRHEIEHVLREDGRQEIFLDELEGDAAGTSSNLPEAERAANASAADFCVPARDLESFFVRLYPLFTEERVIGFARLMKVHPGLVVGQLHNRMKRYDLFRGFLAKIRHIIVQSALTDGYGRPGPVTIQRG
jgi:HTH-type transcriptional regulator / antitoxin HigA